MDKSKKKLSVLAHFSENPHFHHQCRRCGHHWLMRTRIDSREGT